MAKAINLLTNNIQSQISLNQKMQYQTSMKGYGNKVMKQIIAQGQSQQLYVNKPEALSNRNQLHSIKKNNMWSNFGDFGKLVSSSNTHQLYRHHRLSDHHSSDQKQYQQQPQNLIKLSNQVQTIKDKNSDVQKRISTNQQHNIQQNQNQQSAHEDTDLTKNQMDCQELEMIIQLDSQTSIPLKISPIANPLLLAKQFCYNNNIDPKIISLLAKQIKNMQDKYHNNYNAHERKNKSHMNSNNKSKNGNTYNNSHSYNSNSFKQSRVEKNSLSHSNSQNKNKKVYSECSIVMQKQNQQHLANLQYQNNNINPISQLNYQNLQLFNPNETINIKNSQTNTQTNTNSISKSKVYNTSSKNTKNNTASLSNIYHQNNNQSSYFVQPYLSHSHVNPNTNVFDRLYKQSYDKNKRQQQIRVKDKMLQLRQELRNYNYMQTDKYQNEENNQINKDKQLNQSTTYINNLSASNIHHYTSTSAVQSNNVKTVKNSRVIQVKIYEKNLKLKKQVKLRNQQLKHQLEQMVQAEYTGSPEINPLSRLIVKKLREVQAEEGSIQSSCEQQQSNNMFKAKDSRMTKSNLKNSFVRLYQYKEKSKQKSIAKIIQHQKKKQQEQLKQCTFHPKILKKSQRQVINTQRHLLLHEDFYIRQNKVQTIKASQSKKLFERHQPQINEMSRKIVNGRSFQQRMSEYKINAEKKKEKLEKQRKSLQKHHPQINKNSKNNKKSNISIGQYLYSKSLQKKTNSVTDIKKVKCLNKQSQAMYEQMKKNAFRYIFTLMDSDEDGYISALKINILGLQTEILQLLAPLLCQMQQVKIELDEQQFVDSLERLFNTFSIHQKNLILNVYRNPLRKSKYNQQPSFQPSLNQKSIEIARQVREPGLTLYEASKQKQIQKQTRLAEMRALKALMEVEQCTFQPNLFYHH